MSSERKGEKLYTQIFIWIEKFTKSNFEKLLLDKLIEDLVNDNYNFQGCCEKIYKHLKEKNLLSDKFISENDSVYTQEKDHIHQIISTLYLAIDKFLNEDLTLFNKQIFQQNIFQLINQLNLLLRKNKKKYTLLFHDKISLEDFIIYELLRILIQIDAHLVSLQFQLISKNKIFIYMDQFERVTELFQEFYSIESLSKNYGKNLTNQIDKVDKILKEKSKIIVDLSILNNIIFLYKKNNEPFIDQAPFIAYPFKVNKTIFLNLLNKQKLWLELIDKMTKNHELIKTTFTKLGESDDFVKKLYNIYEKARDYKFQSKINYTIIRNDYMFHQKKQLWKQIEFNAIAVAGFNFCQRTQKLHKYLLKNIYNDKYESFNNNNNKVLAKGFVKAYKAYNNDQAYLLFIASKHESFHYDQKMLEQELIKNKIPTMRLIFEELGDIIKVDKDNGKLFIKDKEIAIVYYRHGYRPDHYPTEKEWSIREQIELSNAIKVPSVATQLINFKKIQEVLATTDLLEKTLKHQDQIKTIKQDFAKFWSISTKDDVEKLKAKVKKNPSDYVLKPQNEGGGNNLFGEEMIKAFETLDLHLLQAFTLMELVKPIPRIGYIFKNQQPDQTLLLSELGFYGYIFSTDQIVDAQSAGYLVRSKKSTFNEVNVCSGFGGFDSIIFDPNL